eukprot:scaffold4150_cov117-Cylindrotheca_fusiformis.AAC.1
MAHRVSQVLFRRQMFRHRGNLGNAAVAVGSSGTHRLFDPTPVVAPAFVQNRSMSSSFGGGGGSPSLTANPSYQIY